MCNQNLSFDFFFWRGGGVGVYSNKSSSDKNSSTPTPTPRLSGLVSENVIISLVHIDRWWYFCCSCCDFLTVNTKERNPHGSYSVISSWQVRRSLLNFSYNNKCGSTYLEIYTIFKWTFDFKKNVCLCFQIYTCTR